MEQNIIKFAGNNDKLFSRISINNLSPKLTIIVPETHNAILIKDGQMLQTLSSGKFLLSDFVDLKTETDCVLEVLFLSKTAKLKLLWGTTQKIELFDDTLDQSFRVGLSGDFEVQIGDPRKCYLYLIGAADDLTAEDLQERLRSNVVSALELVILDYMKENHVPFNQISTHKKAMSQKTLSTLSHNLQSEYGISVFSFNIANIIIDSDDFKRLSSMTKTSKTAFCPDCGAEITEGTKFCPNCGRKIAGSKICPKCKSENPDGAKFCQNCGNKL